MTKEDKQLLLKDLCGRLPYGVMVENVLNHEIFDLSKYLHCLPAALENFKPYLRPMDSMTEEEKEELKYEIELELQALEGEEGHNTVSAAPAAFEIDFYNKHHIDYRGLIPMGLALEAPEDMYKEN